MYACPHCQSPTVQVTRKHTVWETFTITNVQPGGTYEEEDAGSFGDTVSAGDWEYAECDRCGATLNIATLFPADVIPEAVYPPPGPAALAPRPWSVLLRYPDYYDDDGGTYYTHVLGASVADAIDSARQDCMADNSDEDGECFITETTDLEVLLVVEGYLPDRKFEDARTS